MPRMGRGGTIWYGLIKIHYNNRIGDSFRQ